MTVDQVAELLVQLRGGGADLGDGAQGSGTYGRRGRLAARLGDGDHAVDDPVRGVGDVPEAVDGLLAVLRLAAHAGVLHDVRAAARHRELARDQLRLRHAGVRRIGLGHATKRTRCIAFRQV